MGNEIERPSRELRDAANIIKAGGLVIYPTETVYGLAADPYNRIAVLKIFGAKNRPMEKPLSVAVTGIKQADELVFVNSEARSIARKLLPGPLTLILKKKARLPKELTAGMDTLGIRIPNNEIALKFIELAGPVTATSANVTGNPPPLTPYEAEEQLGDKVDYILKGGETKIKKPSTVIDLSEGGEIKILRQGSVSKEEIMKILQD